MTSFFDEYWFLEVVLRINYVISSNRVSGFWMGSNNPGVLPTDLLMIGEIATLMSDAEVSNASMELLLAGSSLSHWVSKFLWTINGIRE